MHISAPIWSIIRACCFSTSPSARPATVSEETAYAWLRANILPLCRLWSNHWAGVRLVFGMDGPGKLFNLNEANDLVYFGKASERDAKLCLTRAIWNGASTGNGVFKLLPEGNTGRGSIIFPSNCTVSVNQKHIPQLRN
jgi:hypothetical protein